MGRSVGGSLSRPYIVRDLSKALDIDADVIDLSAISTEKLGAMFNDLSAANEASHKVDKFYYPLAIVTTALCMASFALKTDQLIPYIIPGFLAMLYCTIKKPNRAAMREGMRDDIQEGAFETLKENRDNLDLKPR